MNDMDTKTAQQFGKNARSAGIRGAPAYDSAFVEALKKAGPFKSSFHLILLKAWISGYGEDPMEQTA